MQDNNTTPDNHTHTHLPRSAEVLLSVAEEQAEEQAGQPPPKRIFEAGLVRLPSLDCWSDGVRVGLSYLRVVWEDGAHQYVHQYAGYHGGRPARALTRDEALALLATGEIGST